MVYPPSAYDELVVPRQLTACRNADVKLLKIGAFQPCHAAPMPHRSNSRKWCVLPSARPKSRR